MSILGIFDQFSKSKGVLGIEFGSDYIAFAAREFDRMLQAVSALQPQSGVVSVGDWNELVSEYVDKQGLKNWACNVVLPAQNYQLMLVERPEVPDSELREAVKWKVKDLVGAPLETVVIDVFDLPDAANSAAKKMIYVVVAEKDQILNIIDVVRQSGLRLNSIDIEVLALRNITLLKESQRASAIVRLRQGSGEVSIYREGDLFLSRHFKLNYGAGLLDDIPEDALALEVQRSFDYFERQMKQAPPSVMYVCGDGVGPEKITDSIKRSVAGTVEYLDFATETGADTLGIDEGMQQLCVAAMAAVYRQESA